MKLLVVSEYAPRGSGYTTILRGLLGEWEKRGHQVIVLAFEYNGSAHPFEAAIVPTDPMRIQSQFAYTRIGFKPDCIVVILDLSYHYGFRAMQTDPYIGIFPIESDPLLHPSEWTNCIDTMDGVLCETKFGTQLLVDAGLRARHFPVGIDSQFWRPPTIGERNDARERWNLGDRFVVLTVADNQERKNLAAHFATIALLAGKEIEWPPTSGRKRKIGRREAVPDAYWILNTKRRPRQVGYTNFALAQDFGIQQNTLLLEHSPTEGLEDEGLRELYWASDAFLLLSKAEGYGLPVLEGMSCGLPVVGTDCTGIRESLHPDRGYLVRPEYVHIDPYHNQYRRWADPVHAAECLSDIARGKMPKGMTDRALAYTRSLTWERAADQFEEVLTGVVKEVANVESEPEAPGGTADAPEPEPAILG